jgi:predicted HicB family RNase H-like nuclease
MNDKGYHGVVRLDDESGVLLGKVANLKDVITFQGRTVEEVRQAFRDSVDEYLEFRAGRGEPPERPCNGRLLVRVEPEVHRLLLAEAMDRGISLNQLVSGCLAELVTGAGGDPAEAGSAAHGSTLRKGRKDASTEG